MDTIAAFLSMGGYAAFVWPSYVLSALVLIMLLVASVRALRNSEAALEELQATEKLEKSHETQT